MKAFRERWPKLVQLHLLLVEFLTSDPPPEFYFRSDVVDRLCKGAGYTSRHHFWHDLRHLVKVYESPGNNLRINPKTKKKEKWVCFFKKGI